MLYPTLLFIHSVLRWLVLGFAVNALLRAWRGRASSAAYTAQDRLGALLFVAAFHIDVVLGLTLYSVSPVAQTALANFGAAMKVGQLRFFVMEHPVMMLLAVVLATVGSVRIKRAASDAQKHQRTLVFFGIALLLILAAIPWPFYPAGRALLSWPG
jgi:hypothetical protein